VPVQGCTLIPAWQQQIDETTEHYVLSEATRYFLLRLISGIIIIIIIIIMSLVTGLFFLAILLNQQ
jgi:hypothetical protein